MAYNDATADLLRNELSAQKAVFTEKKMFGGLAFMYKGKMSVGVVRDKMTIRVLADKYPAALADPAASEMDFTGRSMKEFLYVDIDNLSENNSLSDWVAMGLEHAESKAGE